MTPPRQLETPEENTASRLPARPIHKDSFHMRHHTAAAGEAIIEILDGVINFINACAESMTPSSATAEAGAARAWWVERRRRKHGWLCGYMPIEFTAPLSHGSTRKKRDEANERMYQFKLSTCIPENGFLHKYLQSRPAPRPIRAVPLILFPHPHS
jgi:hypothetical protein